MRLVRERVLLQIDRSIVSMTVPNVLFCGRLYLFTAFVIILFSVCSISLYCVCLCSSIILFYFSMFSSLWLKNNSHNSIFYIYLYCKFDFINIYCFILCSVLLFFWYQACTVTECTNAHNPRITCPEGTQDLKPRGYRNESDCEWPNWLPWRVDFAKSAFS